MVKLGKMLIIKCHNEILHSVTHRTWNNGHNLNHDLWFFGWTDWHAREQERQANGNKISYLILLEITARLMEHSKHLKVMFRNVKCTLLVLN